MTKFNVIPHFARLHEYVAIEKGLFDNHGLDAELQHIELMNQHGMYAESVNADVGSEDILEGDNIENAVNSACAWGVACNTGGGKGKFVPAPYIKSKQVFYTDPQTDIKSLEDIANVPIGSSAKSGTHFGSLLALEGKLPDNDIVFKHIGTPREQFQGLLDGEVDVANLMGPYPYMAEQQGYRKIYEQTIPVLFYVTAGASEEELKRYFSALKEADELIRSDPGKYKHHWEQLVPAQFSDFDYDYDKFGVAELLEFSPFPRDKFQEIVNLVERWDLDENMDVSDYDSLTMHIGTAD